MGRMVPKRETAEGREIYKVYRNFVKPALANLSYI